jgi:hypothetical protein
VEPVRLLGHHPRGRPGQTTMAGAGHDGGTRWFAGRSRKGGA